MKRMKIGFTAIALMTGIISSFVTSAASRLGTYWTTTGGGVYLSTVAAQAHCQGTGILCAVQYTAGGNVTGAVILTAP